MGSRGRLEVLHSGVWGTVCGTFFTAVEARVVCMMLGYDWGTKINNRNYTTNDGTIWLNDVRCNGTETDIANCSHSGWGVHNCHHREDVAISCARIQVRLNGGRDPRKSRLEVFYNNIWGFVCVKSDSTSISLGFPEATVVCNMLGFGRIGQIILWYDLRQGPVWLSSMQCSGREKSIAQCTHNKLSKWGVDYHSSCLIRDNVPLQIGVSCLADDTVALFGGGSPREGRLEVYHHFQWGTVCDDGFTDAAARVACHSLGFGYSGQKTDISLYGVGKSSRYVWITRKTKIWLDDVHCSGTEGHIGVCSHRAWGVHNCTHHSDVAVSCFGDPSGRNGRPFISSPITTPSLISILNYTSTQSISSHRVSHIDIITSVVVGLLMIICAIVVVIAVHYRCRLRRDRTDCTGVTGLTRLS